MSELVIIERQGPVAIVTMNRPERRNALDETLVDAIVESLESLQRRGDVRAAILRGDPHFCVGGDLSALDLGPLGMRAAMQQGHRIVRTLIAGRLPVVAAVRGAAFGAGFSMAMACDFVVADTGTTFCAAFGRVGLTPDYGLLWTLPQRVSMGVARELVMLCETVPAARAQQLGLVDRLVEPGHVDSTATELAQRLARVAPGTIETTRAVLSRAPMSLDSVLAWEADIQALLAGTRDFAEGVRAFREKRDAIFSGE